MYTIVLGSNHSNTLGLVWSLGEAGHKVILLLHECKYAYVNKSKYIYRTVIIHEGDSVIDSIKRIALCIEEKPVVLVSSDYDASLLNDHHKDLSDYCFFECGRPDGNLNLFRDKDIGNRLAMQCGLDLPKSCLVNSAGDFSIASFQYPILIKANNSIHGGKRTMRKCDSSLEAQHFINGLTEDFFPILVQEFIDKDFEIMLLGCSLNGGERVVCPVANKKIRHFPSPTGPGSYSESVEVQQNEVLKTLAAKVALYIQDIGYTGNFSAEFLFCKGIYYFLEINLRNDGTSWLSTCSGFNLPDFVCRSLVGENVSEDGTLFHKMFFMNILADFNNVRERKISLFKWLMQFKHNTCYSHYNPKDLIPFLFYLKSVAIESIKAIVKH